VAALSSLRRRAPQHARRVYFCREEGFLWIVHRGEKTLETKKIQRGAQLHAAASAGRSSRCPAQRSAQTGGGVSLQQTPQTTRRGGAVGDSTCGRTPRLKSAPSHGPSKASAMRTKTRASLQMAAAQRVSLSAGKLQVQARRLAMAATRARVEGVREHGRAASA
jgi:hypothetical protein